MDVIAAAYQLFVGKGVVNAWTIIVWGDYAYIHCDRLGCGSFAFSASNRGAEAVTWLSRWHKSGDEQIRE